MTTDLIWNCCQQMHILNHKSRFNRIQSANSLLRGYKPIWPSHVGKHWSHTNIQDSNTRANLELCLSLSFSVLILLLVTCHLN